jgi:plasmid maintenance system antidote protein VapI
MPDRDQQPAEVFHPGALLKEELRARRLYPVQFLSQLPQRMYGEGLRLLQQRAPVSEEMADALERILGVSAQFWLNLQAAFDEWRREAARSSPSTPISQENDPCQ